MFTISSGKEPWKRRSNVVNDNSYQDIRNKRDKIFKCVAIIHCSVSVYRLLQFIILKQTFTNTNNSRKRIRMLRFVVPRQTFTNRRKISQLPQTSSTNKWLFYNGNIHRQILQDSANLVEAQQRILEKEFKSNYDSLFRNKRLPTNFAEKL